MFIDLKCFIIDWTEARPRPEASSKPRLRGDLGNLENVLGEASVRGLTDL